MIGRVRKGEAFRLAVPRSGLGDGWKSVPSWFRCAVLSPEDVELTFRAAPLSRSRLVSRKQGPFVLSEDVLHARSSELLMEDGGQVQKVEDNVTTWPRSTIAVIADHNHRRAPTSLPARTRLSRPGKLSDKAGFRFCWHVALRRHRRVLPGSTFVHDHHRFHSTILEHDIDSKFRLCAISTERNSKRTCDVGSFPPNWSAIAHVQRNHRRRGEIKWEGRKNSNGTNSGRIRCLDVPEHR